MRGIGVGPKFFRTKTRSPVEDVSESDTRRRLDAGSEKDDSIRPQERQGILNYPNEVYLHAGREAVFCSAYVALACWTD